MKVLTENALKKRINRKLAHRYQQLHTTVGGWNSDLGYYYVTDSNRHVVCACLDLEEFGREIGVVKDHERLHGGSRLQKQLRKGLEARNWELYDTDNTSLMILNRLNCMVISPEFCSEEESSRLLQRGTVNRLVSS